MLKHKLLLPEGIMILEPDKPLAVADFEAITQEIDPYIAKHGMLPGLLIHVKTFPGWTNFAAFYAHMGIVERYHLRLQRLALVTDSRFLADCRNLLASSCTRNSNTSHNPSMTMPCAGLRDSPDE